MLWLSPADAGAQTPPGGDGRKRRRNRQASQSDGSGGFAQFDAAVHKIGTAGVLADPSLNLEAWDVNRLGVGQRRLALDKK